MATVNSKSPYPRCEHRALLAETNLRVEYRRHHQHVFIGTRHQLESENMTTLDGRWPSGQDWVRWVDGGMRFTVSLEHKSSLRRLYGMLPDEEHYRLRVEPSTNGADTVLRSQLLEKLDEMEEIKHRGTREHHETFMKHCEASRDRWFQMWLTQVVSGAMPRKGCRARKVNAAGVDHG